MERLLEDSSASPARQTTMNKRKDSSSLFADGPLVEEADPAIKRIKPTSGWNAVLYGVGALCSVGALMCASATVREKKTDRAIFILKE